MKSEKREYKDYMADIWEAINSIEKFTVGLTFEDFLRDERTLLAVIRKLEIIGEAARKIPEKVKKNYTQIPWEYMTGMRNKLIHEYFGVNTEVVWKTIKENLPEVKEELKKVLKEMGINYQ